jgi:hypothetical protein
MTYFLICHNCGKQVPIADENAMLWMKILELTEIVGRLAVQTNAGVV